MPWDSPQQFQKRHAKKLSPARAGKAKSIAEAMMARGAKEGMSIATGIKRAKSMKGFGAKKTK